MKLKVLLSIYYLPALLFRLLLTPFTTEEMTGCTNEAAKDTNKAGRSAPSCFFISYFTVSVMPSINTFESSIDVCGFNITVHIFIQSK